MSNVAIITARAGSKSIIDKNVYPVLDKPLVTYPIEAAQQAEAIAEVYVSTDGEAIAQASTDAGATVIARPDALGGDTINHGDVIKHAVEHVDQALGGALTNVVLLLGNTVMVDGDLIDQALEVLESDTSLDSVMTVWEAADDHPYRALEIEDGLVRSWTGKLQNISTERQSYPTIYYYDQGVWAFRKDCVQRTDGPAPWWWMGKRVKPIIRTWVTGRDIHTHFDLLVSEHYLRNRAAYRSQERRDVAP